MAIIESETSCFLIETDYETNAELTILNGKYSSDSELLFWLKHKYHLMKPFWNIWENPESSSEAHPANWAKMQYTFLMLFFTSKWNIYTFRLTDSVHLSSTFFLGAGKY